MLGVVVVPIVLLGLGVVLGRPELLAGKPAHLRQLRASFFANQTYLQLALTTVTSIP